MIDKEKVEAGVRLILEGIGEDVNREGLLETRIVLHGCMKKSLAEWTWMPQSL